MIPEAVRADILGRLAKVERDNNVRILLAVESGSRAWGFASTDSDYDVRFIYARSSDWYLAIDLEEKRDVIEYPIVDEIDLNGWDVKKALRLMARSNPAIVEWLLSPIHYLEQGVFASSLRQLLPSIYSWVSGIQHYRSMAKATFHSRLQGDYVSLKKYFYVLRPLLAVRWLQQYKAPAPLEFVKLLTMIEDRPALLADIQSLLAKKRVAPELGMAPPIASIHAFILEELARLEQLDLPKAGAADWAALNAVFRRVIGEQR